MTRAVSNGLSLSLHFVIHDVFNFSFSLEPKSIPSAADPPVDQATGQSLMFFEMIGT